MQKPTYTVLRKMQASHIHAIRKSCVKLQNPGFRPGRPSKVGEPRLSGQGFLVAQCPTSLTCCFRQSGSHIMVSCVVVGCDRLCASIGGEPLNGDHATTLAIGTSHPAPI